MEQIYLQALYNQKEKLKLPADNIERELFESLRHYFYADNRINIITGLRRTGKSTLLKNLIYSLNNFIFINFDDERLSQFAANNFNVLNEAALRVYGKSDYYFFDEIQNVPGFEVFVRRLHDEGKKIVITGSNSSLLSVELGSKLTGRYKSFELYPFSFSEYLLYNHVELSESSFYVSEEKVELLKHFDFWFNNGGLPEYLKYKDADYVKTLYENIIYRDIVARYGIKKISELQSLARMLTNNLSLPITYNALKNALQLSNAETVKEYLGYLSNSWLFFELRKYSESLKQQLRAPKKVYMIDIAFNKLIGFNTSENLGRRLENIVYVELKRRNNEIYYYQNGGECDFVVKTLNENIELFQVCYNLNPQNNKREIAGLISAMNYFRINNASILTYNQEEIQKIENKKIRIIPVWKWMLAK